MGAAWEAYRDPSEFQETFTHAKKAFAERDLTALAQHLVERQADRASQRAARLRRLRDKGTRR